MDELHTLQSLGLELPTPAYLFGTLLFGIIGFAAWRYGRKAAHPAAKWLGIALMFYPYAVSQTWLLYTFGGALCAALYCLRE